MSYHLVAQGKEQFFCYLVRGFTFDGSFKTKKGPIFLYSTQHGLYFDSEWMSSLVVPNVMITEGTNPIARIPFNGWKFVTWKHTFHAEELIEETMLKN